MIDIKAIKAAAEAATPQPWIDPGEGNMPFICMMTPATVIALCDEIERLREPPSESGICQTCGSACNERDELIKAEREIERLRQQLAVYEKHGVTCQTFGHKLTGCAECNRDDAAESVNETNAVLANNYLALVPEIERQQFHISTLETDNAEITGG